MSLILSSIRSQDYGEKNSGLSRCRKVQDQWDWWLSRRVQSQSARTLRSCSFLWPSPNAVFGIETLRGPRMAEVPKQIAKSNSWTVFPRILAMVTPICTTKTFNSCATDSRDRWYDDSVLRDKLWQNNSSPTLQIPLKANRFSSIKFYRNSVCLNRHAITKRIIYYKFCCWRLVRATMLQIFSQTAEFIFLKAQ